VETLIKVAGLVHSYGKGDRSLNGVDFSLRSGETVAILGPNGSGKTTFLLCLVGLLEGEGQIEVCGLPVVKKNFAAIRRKIGILFQDSDDQLFMPTVFDDVAFGPLNLGLQHSEVKERVQYCLHLVGMEAAASKAPYHLSAGEKRRVALAGVLATEPEILILDEPVTFLDPPGRAVLVDILSRLPQAKLIVSHDVDLARELAVRAVFFEQGAIAASGPVEEIVERYRWDTAPRVTR
jgi:cobalt/nickel transport system ATP-binding protein